MARHIKGKDGKFQGSVGDGKTKVPTTGPRVAAQPEEVATGSTVDTAQRLYHERIRTLAVATDTELVQQQMKQFSLEQHVQIDNDELHRVLGHRQERVTNGRRYQWVYTKSMADTVGEAQEVLADPETPDWKKRSVQRVMEERAQHISELSEVNHRISELNATYLQHRWTRAFLVPGGHVHSNMDCFTCNKGEDPTKFVWLPQYSGSDENQIIEDAGERACSASCCYPNAPVSVLQRPTRIFSDDERRELEAAEKRRAEREERRAARAAKAPTASGEPLVLTVGTREWRGETLPREVELKTERTALTYAVDILAAQRSGNSYFAPYEVSSSHYDDTVNAICDSVAEKRGVTRADILAELEPKVARKIR